MPSPSSITDHSADPDAASNKQIWDVLIIGGGNAGFAAALSAAETLSAKFCTDATPKAGGIAARTPRILILDRAPAAWMGGNTRFTAGAYRTVFGGKADVLGLVHNVERDNVQDGEEQSEQHGTNTEPDGITSTAAIGSSMASSSASHPPPQISSRIDMAPYTSADFHADLTRVTLGRTDPALARVLVDDSYTTVQWLAARCGIRFQLSFHRQAYAVGGRWKFWGGMVLCVEDGGKGLIRQYAAAAERVGVQVEHEVEVVEFLWKEEEHTRPEHALDSTAEEREVVGVRVRRKDGEIASYHAHGGIVLCAGGFEADSRMRRTHLGEQWERAYVRGTPYNTGGMLELAIRAGAKRAGDWEGCHATCWDANAPRSQGDLGLTNQFTKSGYPLGVMINVHGRRFVDEGLDLRNYTYAKFGRAILSQTDGVAFQVWDTEGAKWLREEEYADDVVRRISADSVEDLAVKLGQLGLRDQRAFEKTLEEFNYAVHAHRREHPELSFDPSVKDRLSTRSENEGLTLDKTNWALPIEKPPFLAVKVACGVTFTFGGLAVDPETATVLSSTNEKPIPGLFCAGEMLGGLFWGNYPGGSGLTAGAVFGRRAGRAAAMRVAKHVKYDD